MNGKLRRGQCGAPATGLQAGPCSKELKGLAVPSPSLWTIINEDIQ